MHLLAEWTSCQQLPFVSKVWNELSVSLFIVLCTMSNKLSKEYDPL